MTTHDSHVDTNVCRDEWMALIFYDSLLLFDFHSHPYFVMILLFSDTLLKNETSAKPNLIETMYAMRPENNAQNNALPNDRKGVVAIGQSVLYTDFPPKDFSSSESGKRFLLFFISFFSQRLSLAGENNKNPSSFSIPTINHANKKKGASSLRCTVVSLLYMACISYVSLLL